MTRVRSNATGTRALKPRTMIETMANPIQPSVGGCITSATMSATITRAAPIAERITAILVVMLQLPVRAGELIGARSR